jgi:hypothetical protein
MRIKHIIFILLLLSSNFIFSQLANDDCINATPLGNLPIPVNCGNGPNANGQGAPIVFNNLSNIGAQTENPYTTLTNCQGGPQGMSSPATDVWYSFVPTGNSLDISINGAINQPNIGIWTGTCGSLIGVGCDFSNGGNLNTTIAQVSPGQTYYIQISGGNINDEGIFDLTLQNNNSCDDCLLSSNLSVTPAPINGTYQPGTTVTFCFTITEWSQENTNWFHGMVPVMGNNWINVTPVSPANTCDNGPGIWSWFNNVGTPNGNSNGFFFDGAVAGLNTIPDGDPTNNFGDNCQGNTNWEFCWEATTANCPPGINGDDLSISIETYADGETGSWTNVACQTDPIYSFSASLTCCPPPTVLSSDENCFGADDGSITVTGQGTAPFDYQWIDPLGNNFQNDNNNNGSSNENNLSPGDYTVVVVDDNGCITNTIITILAGGQANTQGIWHN